MTRDLSRTPVLSWRLAACALAAFSVATTSTPVIAEQTPLTPPAVERWFGDFSTYHSDRVDGLRPTMPYPLTRPEKPDTWLYWCAFVADPYMYGILDLKVDAKDRRVTGTFIGGGGGTRNLRCGGTVLTPTGSVPVTEYRFDWRAEVNGTLEGVMPLRDKSYAFGKPMLSGTLVVRGSITSLHCRAKGEPTECGELSPGNPTYTMSFTGESTDSTALGGIRIDGGKEVPEGVVKDKVINPFSGTWRAQKCEVNLPNSLEVNPEPCLARAKAQLPPWQYTQK